MSRPGTPGLLYDFGGSPMESEKSGHWASRVTLGTPVLRPPKTAVGLDRGGVAANPGGDVRGGSQHDQARRPGRAAIGTGAAGARTRSGDGRSGGREVARS